jgi:hypothetical protein
LLSVRGGADVSLGSVEFGAEGSLIVGSAGFELTGSATATVACGSICGGEGFSTRFSTGEKADFVGPGGALAGNSATSGIRKSTGISSMPLGLLSPAPSRPARDAPGRMTRGSASRVRLMVTVLGVCDDILPSPGCPQRVGKTENSPRSFRGPSVIGYGCNDLEGWRNFNGASNAMLAR